MGLIAWFKEKIRMLFKTDAEKAFGVETYLSPEMDAAIKLWGQLEGAHELTPPWAKGKVETIRFSNTLADELAKLIVQNIDIKVEGLRPGIMPEQMQKVFDEYVLQKSTDFMCDVAKFGGVMAKWDGKGIQFLRPDMFLVTEFDSNGDIHGCIFFSYHAEGKKYYTRAEWHRFESVNRTNEATGQTETVSIYHISNKAFLSDNQNEIGREVPLSRTIWADIAPEVWAENIVKPLFRYIKCPTSNTIDPDSPLGVPCFVNCMAEFKAIDTAWSTMQLENRNSEPMLIVDQSAIQYANMNGIELPEFISKTGLDLSESNSPVEQWQPTLQVTTRKEAINFYISVAAFKCGFDPGYFVFDGQTVQMATATQVRVTQKRTADTVMSYRDVLDRPMPNGEGRVGAIHDIAYIINAMLMAYGANGVAIPNNENGNYKLFCSFSDLLANEEEDALMDKQLADTGYMPKWKWLVLHRGYTEKEARALVAEAQMESMGSEQEGLFGDEYMPLQKNEESDSESTNKGLNGAQTQSLITIISQQSAGMITEGQAINLIATAIGVSKDEAKKILAGQID